MSQRKFCLYGLTGNPIHFGHVDTYNWLLAQGFTTLVVPAIGHEGKPEAYRTYEPRKIDAGLVFGSAMIPLEDEVRKTFPLPIMAFDVLEAALAMLNDASSEVAKLFNVDPTEPVTPADIFFAIGPDVQLDGWTKIEKIRAAGYGFVVVPEIPNIRSTLIRDFIARGEPWEHLVPAVIADGIKAQGKFGWKA